MNFEKFQDSNHDLDLSENEKRLEERQKEVSRRKFLEKTAYAAAGAIGISLGSLSKQRIELEKQAERAGREVKNFVPDEALEDEEIIDEPARPRRIEEYEDEPARRREEISSLKLKEMRPDVGYKEIYMPKIENLNFPGTVGTLGSSDHDAKILRTLRYKNITDAVEDKYNLPPGVLMSIIIQESTGVDLLPNALGDGGFGLAHMQGYTAHDFGLRTFGGCKSMVCGPRRGTDGKIKIVGCADENGVPQNHGQKLKDFIEEHKDDRKSLVEADDRLHVLLNIDAAGRMLASYSSGSKIKGLGPFRTSLARYAGMLNFKKDYWTNIKRNMRDLSNSEFISSAVENFNSLNPDLKVDGVPVDYHGYIKAIHKQNENYDLIDYKKTPKYKPKNSEEVLASYKDFIKE